MTKKLPFILFLFWAVGSVFAQNSRAVSCTTFLDGSPLSRTSQMIEEQVKNGICEGLGQRYNGLSGTVNSVRFWARVNPTSGIASMVVKIFLKTPQGNGSPGPIIGTGQCLISIDSSSTLVEYTAILNGPTSISNSTIITIEPNVSTYDFYVGRNTAGDAAGASLSYYRQASTWFTNLVSNIDPSYDADMLLLPVSNTSVTANFSSSASSNTINFSNTSVGATSYLWSFGDGNTSTAISPSHVYATSNTYDVKLEAITQSAFGGVCIDSITKSVNVILSGINSNQAEKKNNIIIQENPVNEILIITTDTPELLSIYNVIGAKLIEVKTLARTKTEINVSSLGRGIYFVGVEQRSFVKFIKN
jgi:PKD repeat protein